MGAAAMQGFVVETLLRRSVVGGLLAATLTGCNGAIWGNLSVLLITCGIFLGTLTLGRRAVADRSGPAEGAVTDAGGSPGAPGLEGVGKRRM